MPGLMGSAPLGNGADAGTDDQAQLLLDASHLPPFRISVGQPPVTGRDERLRTIAANRNHSRQQVLHTLATMGEPPAGQSRRSERAFGYPTDPDELARINDQLIEAINTPYEEGQMLTSRDVGITAHIPRPVPTPITKAMNVLQDMTHFTQHRAELDEYYRSRLSMVDYGSQGPPRPVDPRRLSEPEVGVDPRPMAPRAPPVRRPSVYSDRRRDLPNPPPRLSVPERRHSTSHAEPARPAFNPGSQSAATERDPRRTQMYDKARDPRMR